MKKWIAIFLLLSMALPLCGCVPEWPKDTFYRADILAECDLSDLPVPKLENSRLGGEYLYCNLTQEEYEAYVAELVAYLRGREDIYNLCYRYGRTLQFGAFPLDTCAPLPEDYDYTGDQHAFVFTYTEALGDDNRMADPIRISVIRETGTLFRTDFTYNTIIQLQPASSIPAELDYCAGKHTYDEGYAYPVPGLDRQVTVRSCIHCGGREFSEYIGSENRKLYDVTVTEGRAHILRNNWNQVQSWDRGGDLQDLAGVQAIDVPGFHLVPVVSQNVGPALGDGDGIQLAVLGTDVFAEIPDVAMDAGSHSDLPI